MGYGIKGLWASFITDFLHPCITVSIHCSAPSAAASIVDLWADVRTNHGVLGLKSLYGVYTLSRNNKVSSFSMCLNMRYSAVPVFLLL